jgi:hypothetical protein
MKIEIMFSDLKKEKQKEILKKLKLKSEKDMNWDILPFDVFEFEDYLIGG